MWLVSCEHYCGLILTVDSSLFKKDNAMLVNFPTNRAAKLDENMRESQSCPSLSLLFCSPYIIIINVKRPLFFEHRISIEVTYLFQWLFLALTWDMLLFLRFSWVKLEDICGTDTNRLWLRSNVLSLISFMSVMSFIWLWTRSKCSREEAGWRSFPDPSCRRKFWGHSLS